MRPAIVAVATVVMLAVAGLTGCGDSGDQAVLDELSAAGADLSQPREVRYYLYVDTAEQADEVAAQLSRDDRSVSVEQSADGSEWLVLVTEHVIVDTDTLAARRSEFEGVLSSVGGEYDGWEAAVDP
jgi:hypothetical protein